MSDAARPSCLLPERIFAIGEEPGGVRVTPYHKPSAIGQILDALRPEEVEHIRASPFGKLIEITEKPTFSGRFGRYIISRQLKVIKKHEAWFLFAGKPIRFSIREFALVTGLNCDKFPKRRKMKTKNFMSEKPYWGELFGSLREVPVSSAIRMLKTRKVVDNDMRLKYAYLCLLSAVILPTTHAPRIYQPAAEMIKDWEAFFAYPWGRCSFDMLMSSIKERKEVSLSQNTIALKGFVLALQLVMVECVPALTEVVQEGNSSESEDDGGGDEDIGDSEKKARRSISPGHARDTDAAGKAFVHSIMLDSEGGTTLAEEFQWSDDEEDIGVSNMMNLIEQRFEFSSDCFVGGATKLDVCRMREEAKADMVNRKTVKNKNSNSSQTQDGVDMDLLASLVREKLKEDFQFLNQNITSFQESANGSSAEIQATLNELCRIVKGSTQQISNLTSDISKLAGTGTAHQTERSTPRPSVVDRGTQTFRDAATIISEAMNFANRGTDFLDRGGPSDSSNRHVDQATNPSSHPSAEVARPQSSPAPTGPNVDPGLVFPNPTFSLGLTQEAPLVPPTAENVGVQTVNDSGEQIHKEPVVEEAAIGCRKSKRQKVPTKSLLGEYECDKGFINRARKAVADAIYNGGDIDYAAKFAALLDKMNSPFDIETEEGLIKSTELCEVVEKASPLSNKMVDVLMSHTRTLFRSQPLPTQQPSSAFMGTQFVSKFTKLYPKFTKVSRKDSFKFNVDVVDMFVHDPLVADASRFYFPFNLDKKHWVGICVDCSSWSVTVMDCNNAIRSEYMMNKEVRPIALMFPYLLKQVGRDVGARDCKAMAIDRPRSIPQQKEATFSGVSSVLFMQAHAVGGVDACKCITPDVLDSQVERLVVTLYEAKVGPL